MYYSRPCLTRSRHRGHRTSEKSIDSIDAIVRLFGTGYRNRNPTRQFRVFAIVVGGGYLLEWVENKGLELPNFGAWKGVEL